MHHFAINLGGGVLQCLDDGKFLFEVKSVLWWHELIFDLSAVRDVRVVVIQLYCLLSLGDLVNK